MNVVITGSTRGLGLGIAQAFLERGHRVVISGRGNEGTAQVVASLGAHYGRAQVLGKACDVAELAQVESLWQAAAATFGEVDIWLNNAGVSASRHPFWELPPERVEEMVRTNLLGVMNGSKVAISGMLGQGHGLICNMEGLGSDGTTLPGSALYGTTKAAVTYLTRALSGETKGTPVRFCLLSPGMVLTEMSVLHDTHPDDLNSSDSRLRRLASILTDPVDRVAPFLVGRILANPRHGTRIDWLPRRKMVWRLLTAPLRRRDAPMET